MGITQQLWRLREGKAVSSRLTGPTALSIGKEEETPTAVVMPIKPLDEAIAALIVPDDYLQSIACNGVLLGAGLHPLAHAAHLEVGGTSFWVSLEALPEDDQYDPQRHGAGQRCAVTKRTFEIDDPVTLCPGTAATPCTAIYKRSVWQKALAGSKPFKCPFCKYTPGTAAWKPTLPPRSDRLRRLLDLIAKQEPTP